MVQEQHVPCFKEPSDTGGAYTWSQVHNFPLPRISDFLERDSF